MNATTGGIVPKDACRMCLRNRHPRRGVRSICGAPVTPPCPEIVTMPFSFSMPPSLCLTPSWMHRMSQRTESLKDCARSGMSPDRRVQAFKLQMAIPKGGRQLGSILSTGPFWLTVRGGWVGCAGGPAKGWASVQRAGDHAPLRLRSLSAMASAVCSSIWARVTSGRILLTASMRGLGMSRPGGRSAKRVRS